MLCESAQAAVTKVCRLGGLETHASQFCGLESPDPGVSMMEFWEGPLPSSGPVPSPHPPMGKVANKLPEWLLKDTPSSLGLNPMT